MKHICLIFIALMFVSCNTIKTPKEEFTVDLRSPQIPVGEIELQFDTFLSLIGLKKETIAVSYFPLEDAVCLEYREEFVTYHQFWSYDGRLEFISALEKYNKDFEERNLAGNSRKSLRNYGVVEGYLIWQMSRITIQARANMEMELGYRFRSISRSVSRTPYFTVNQRAAEYTEELSRDNNRTSPEITMFFTRAQAAELAAFFDQDFLRSLVQTPANTRPAEPGRDTY